MERLHHLLVPGDYLVVAWMDLNKLKVPLGTKVPNEKTHTDPR